MKAIEWFWNLMFYYLFNWYVKANRLLDYFNPFYWFNKKSIVKEHKASHGISDWNKFTDDFMNNPKTGLGLGFVYYTIGGLFTQIVINFLAFVMFLLKRSVFDILDSTFLSVIVGGVIILITIRFNHLVLYRNDKYLDYFAKFGKLSDKKKMVYGWLCFGVIILIWVIFFATLSLQGKYAPIHRR